MSPFRIAAFLCLLFASGANAARAQDAAADPGADGRDIRPLELAAAFFARLQGDTPFTYADEIHFLGEFGSEASVLLLQKTGIIDDEGEYLADPPEYSPLGELLRMNAAKWRASEKASRLFTGSPVYWQAGEKTAKPARDGDFSITYRQVPMNFPIPRPVDAKTEFKKELTITIDFYRDMGILVFPFHVDGISALEILGFEKDGKERLILPDRTLHALKSWLDRLNGTETEDGMVSDKN